MTDVYDIWNKYEELKQEHLKDDIYENVKMCCRFYEGDQWYGVEKSGERLPKYNFIRPSVDYKVSMVSNNVMSIHYSPMGNMGKSGELYSIVCDNFNKIAEAAWENTSMDSKLRNVVKRACITGDSYMYFYDGNFNSQIISKENIFFADETQSDIQKQEYIIVFERRRVDEVKKEALINGIPEKDLDLITADDDEMTDDNNYGSKKCTSLLYMYKKGGSVCYLRCVKNLIYEPKQVISGLKLYPICSFVWNGKYNSSRGIGEVYEMIPNQISANALLVRREMNNKMTGYAKPVYNADMIENPESISKVGTAIKISGPGIQNVADAFSYIAPAPMSGTVKQLQDEILNVTRELSGAGDAVVGQINPENASGTAIIAVQEQASLSLNEYVCAYKQFIEDTARVWFNMYAVYNPDGMKAEYESDGKKHTIIVPSHILEKMQINVKVDVSPANAFSKFAREQALENALTKGYITFDEYVSALDGDSAAPRGKFLDIIRKRKLAQIKESEGTKDDVSDLQNGNEGIAHTKGGD